MITVAMLLLAATQIITAQPGTRGDKPVPLAVAPVADREPGSNLTVYLLTMGPGDQVWEKFGHNAIWIHDATAGTDSVYHWGLFDFADKDFVPRFIQGRMRYSMGGFDMAETVEAYRRTNRTVWSQELNLSPAQRRRLADFIAWNMRPENRYYSYDYFRDNCSTRVRDAIDNAAGGVIRAASGSLPSGTTFRFHTARLTQDDWGIFTGTMMGLGQPTDEPISAWEEMFLPVRMMERLKSVQITTTSGTAPIVRDEKVLVQAARAPEASSVHRGMFGYLAIAIAVAGLGAALVVLLRQGGAVIAIATVWSLVAGVAGTLIAFLWFFTDHLYSYRNENLFQLNPLSLVLAALLIRALWKRRRSEAARADTARREALWVALVVAGISALGFALQALPGLDQANAPVIALAMPLHISLAAFLATLATPKKERAPA